MHFRDNQLAYHHYVYDFLQNSDFTGLAQFLQLHTEYLTPDGLSENPFLHLACRYGSSEMVKIMFEQLGDELKILMRKQVAEGWTPIHLAAVYGQADLMQTLMDILDKEAPEVIAITLNDNTKATALHFAISAAKTDLVKILLNASREQVVPVASMMLGEEWTALHLVVHCGDPEMVAALLTAIGYENALPMAKLYLKSGMNILHLTAIACDPEMSDLILEVIPDDLMYELGQARVGSLDNATPLNLAIQYGLNNMVKRLLIALKELASPICLKKMANGWNAFMQICYFGNVEMLKATIQALGKEDTTKQILQPFSQMKNATPFHMVVNRGHVAMTKVLLATVDKEHHNAMINAAQTDGITPVHLAKRFYNDDILDLFRETGAVTN